MTKQVPMDEQQAPLIMEQIAHCKYFLGNSVGSLRTPILCTKFSGSSVPISVNLATCLSCQEYKIYPE
jgi:hypothetical protein